MNPHYNSYWQFADTMSALTTGRVVLLPVVTKDATMMTAPTY